MLSKKLVFKTAMLLFIFQALSFGQSISKTGTTAAKFLSIGVGPRANAMGGAYSAIGDDASSMYWNPAGIGNVKSYQGIFTYTKLFADINLNYFGVVTPVEGVGNFGIGVTALNYGQMEITTELNPEGIGTTFSAGSYAFGISFARYITQDFVIGATIKYIRENIYNSSADGFAIDVGTMFNTPFWGIKFASSITNFGTKMQMKGTDLLVRTTSGNNTSIDANLATDQFELPLRLQIGISKNLKLADGYNFLVDVDAVYPNDNKQWVNVGGELSMFNNLIALRAGYKTLFLKDSQEGLTLGFGINYKLNGSFGIQVDYAYQKLDYLANNHSFGIILNF